MTKALAGTLALQATPLAVIAASAPVQPSFDIAMPPPQEPFDTSVITAVGTVGAFCTK